MKQYQLCQKEVKLLKIPTVEEGNLYANYGWDTYNSRGWYGKWVQHSVRFRYDKNPGHFAWPMIHLWRSFKHCAEYGHKMQMC